MRVTPSSWKRPAASSRPWAPACSPPRRRASACNCTEQARLAELSAYRAEILPEWIDYNGHLRDAYYVLILSYAVDEVMEGLGLGAAYRERTRCTLYTLEL